MDAHFTNYIDHFKSATNRKIHPKHAGRNFTKFKAVCKYNSNGIINTKLPEIISQFQH